MKKRKLNDRWWVARPCDDCPFTNSCKGTALRRSLHQQRMPSIREGLRRGEHFHCHKTTHSRRRMPLICGGSRNYQRRLGIVSNFEQVLTRLRLMRKGTLDAQS